MLAPTPYIFFDGTARDALSFYAGIFGRIVDDLQELAWAPGTVRSSTATACTG